MASVEETIAQVKADRRRFRRVRVDLAGKLFLPQTGQEMTCVVDYLSVGGASIRADMAMRCGEKMVLYVDGLGRFEGFVARIDGFSFGVSFTSTALKRERTAEQLTVFINRNMVDESSLRAHERIAVSGSLRIVRTDGQMTICEVTDLSIGGLMLKTELRPEEGEFLLVGPLAARVARVLTSGVGLEFVGITFPNIEMARSRLGLV